MKKMLIVLILTVTANITFAQVNENELLTKATTQVKEQLKTNLSIGLNNQTMLNAYNAVVQSQMQEEVKVRVLSKIAQAHQAGLPAEPLAEKVMEGLAKRANESQLENALNQLTERYSYAKQLTEQLAFNQQTKSKIMGNIADALAAGISKQSMENIMSHSQLKSEPELAAEITECVKDMSRARVQSNLIEKTMTKAIEKGYNAGELAEIRNQFKTMAKTRDANQLAQNMQNGFQMGAKSSDISKGLSGNGNGSNMGSGYGDSSGMGSGSGGSSGNGGSGGSSGGSSGNGGGHGGGGKGM
ncbi:hypothetical protein DSN97_02710 [Deferribacteraceae bacterium V6Fe1]|nr:hypothetical protein DSN97_02710 [Deferribacteraceae bacterium V6Fe1]